MNRLTKFSNECNEYMCSVPCYEYEVNDCGVCPHFSDVVDKLGKYEDSGLEPETVKKVAEFMKLFPQLSDKYLKGE